MSLIDEVKKLALLEDIDYVGVAPIVRFKNAPNGYRPNDILESCKSVISLGIKISDGVKIANQKAYSGLRNCIYIYMNFGYIVLNDKLDLAALRISRLLEKRGYISIPIPASRPSDPYELRGVFSHRHAAVAAGLGEFGWNGLLITPDAGSRVRLVSILTEAELEPSPMYSGDRLCKREKCGICISVCPTNAISGDKYVKVEIDNRVFEYAKINKTLCRYGTSGLIRKALGRQDVEIPKDPIPEDFLKALGREDPWQKMERAASMCGRCIINCPAPIK
ncbi:MAG: 4Fe-4S binding protein [Candidatus Methanomethylicia archaeon]